MPRETHEGGSKWSAAKEIIFVVLGVIHTCVCLLVGLALLLEE